MPLRRASPEPSPRLRALLDSVDVRGSGPSAHQAGTGSAAQVDPRSPIAAADEPWLPERSWVAAAGQTAPGGRIPATGTARPGRHRRPSPPPPAFLALPAALRGARLSVPRLATVGVLLIVVLAAGAFGVRVAWAKAASAPHAIAPTAGGRAASAGGSAVVPGPGRGAFASSTASAGAAGANGAGGEAGAAGAAAAPASAAGGTPGPTGAATVTVDVVGQVVRPGVVRLPMGSRVTDAVASAGGPRPGADLAAINLARVLVDGEQVRIPRPGETPVSAEGAPSAGGPPGGPAGPGGGPGSAPVNLNTATLTDLDQLPGVGPVLAQRILDWRSQHQRFASVDELGEVSGIGDKLLGQLRPKVVV